MAAKRALQAAGHALLVGEGNLTYAVDAVKRNLLNPKTLVATVFEPRDEAMKKYENMRRREKFLKDAGVKVLFDIDATQLADYEEIQKNRYELIRWNHPHHDTAKSSEIKKNQELIDKFLQQAQKVLDKDGKVAVLLSTDFPYGHAAEKEEDDDADDVSAEKEEEDDDADDVSAEKEEDDDDADDVSAEKEEDDDADDVSAEKEEDDDADDVSAEKEEDALFAYPAHAKGWNIKALGKKSGLTFFECQNFNYREHVGYKPSKGFGNDPNSHWAKGKALVYNFKMDPNLPSPQQQSGLKLLDKNSKK